MSRFPARGIEKFPSPSSPQPLPLKPIGVPPRSNCSGNSCSDLVASNTKLEQQGRDQFNDKTINSHFSENYIWLDSNGKQTTPPGTDFQTKILTPMRKISFDICKNDSLGLMIRGGAEYGLGIYVTGVEENSVASLYDIKPGDEIVEANGKIFASATHGEAVHILKYSNHLSLLLRQVGKVPMSSSSQLNNHPPPFERSSSKASSLGGSSSNASTIASAWSPKEMSKRKNGNYNLDHCISSSSSPSFVSTKQVFCNRKLTEFPHQHQEQQQQRQLQMLEPTTPSECEDIYFYSSPGAGFPKTVPKSANALQFPHHDKITTGGQIDKNDYKSSLGVDFCRPGAISQYANCFVSSSSSSNNNNRERTRRSISSRHSEGIFDDSFSPEFSMVMEKALVLLSENEFEALRHLLHEYEMKTLHIDTLAEELSDMISNSERVSFFTEIREIVRPEDRDRFDHLIYDGTFFETSGDWQERLSFSLEDNNEDDDENDDEEYDEFNTGEPSSSPQFAAYSATALACDTKNIVDPLVLNDDLEEEKINDHVKERDDYGFKELNGKQAQTSVSTTYSSSAQRNVYFTKEDQIELSKLEKEPKNYFSSSSHVNEFRMEAEVQTSPFSETPYDVRIRKSQPTLGIAIEGGANTNLGLPRIIAIQPNGSADENGGLRVGQLIKEVDGIKLTGLSHEDAAKLIASSFAKKQSPFLKLVVMDKKPTAAEKRRSCSSIVPQV